MKQNQQDAAGNHNESSSKRSQWEDVSARANGPGVGHTEGPARDHSLLPECVTLLSSGESRKVNESLRLDADFEGAGGMTQTPDTAAPAGGNRIIQGAEDALAFARGDESKAVLHEAPVGDLISREAHLDLLAAVIAANIGTVLRLPGTADTLTMGELTEQVDALRALPAAPEAGEVYLLSNERDNLVTNLERAEARLAEVEAERDALVAAGLACADGMANPTLPKVQLAISLINSTAEARKAGEVLAEKLKAELNAARAQVAGAYEAAIAAIASGLTGHDFMLASGKIRALTPADATAAFERAVDARVQAALAAQREPVAGRYEARICKGMPADCCDYGVISLDTGLEICRVWKVDDARRIAGLLNAAPASAGVTVTPLDLRNAVQAGFDAWAAKPHNKKWARKIDGTPIPNDVVVCIQTAVCATLSQPA